MLTLKDVMDVTGMVLGFFWQLWPLILIRSAADLLSRKSRRSFFRPMLITWGFLVVFRILAAILAPSFHPFIIPDPLNTFLLVMTGVVLIGINVVRQRFQQAWLIRKGTKISRPSDLLEISPTGFEEMVASVYRAQGHQVQRTGAVGDHGVDVVVRAKNGEKWIVQCKRWRGTVGERVVREFYGTMQHEKADRGAIVTTGDFTPQAREWAKGKPIYLYNGEDFLRIWRRVIGGASGAAPNAVPEQEPAPSTSGTGVRLEPPRCPRCGVTMVLRTAKRGSQKGRLFYGCPNYPLCREIVNVPTGHED